MRNASYNRYRTRIIDPDGQVWRSPRHPVIDTTPKADDVYHTVLAGERLDLIAHKYLKDARLWWILAAYNNKFWLLDLEVGEELRIPSFDRLHMELLR